MKQNLKSSTYRIPGLIIALIMASTLLSAKTVPMFPDCELRVISDNHIILNYNPELSDDLITVGRTGLHPLGDGEVRGRVILVAVPPEGEISVTANFARAGTVIPSSTENYISENMPLVIEGRPIEARGHRIARLVVFPQRLEGDHLAVYKDFVIDITISGSNGAVVNAPQLTRLDSVLAGTVVNPEQFYSFGTASVNQATFKPLSDPFEEANEWVRVAINESGVTRLTGAALASAGINLAGLRSDSIRVYYAGGVNPPDSLHLPEPELKQITVMVEDGGDGYFHAGDYLLFYAQGPNRYEIEDNQEVYIKNSYNDKNYYWVAIGGFDGGISLRWSWLDGRPTSTPDKVASYTRYSVHAERDSLIKVDGDNRIRNYFDWFWSNQSEQTVSINLPYLVPGDSVDVLMRAISSYNSTAMWLNGTPMGKMNQDGNFFRFWDNSGSAVPGLNSLKIDIFHVSGYYLDFLDVNYSRKLHYDGTQLSFNSQSNAGIIHYRISGYTPSNYVLDITDADSVFLINGVEIMGDTARFQRPESSVGISRYITYAPNSILNPVAVEKANPTDLRRDFTQYDCIAVAPRSFIPAVEEYASYRFETGGYRVKPVAVEDIYCCFGYGLLSPMAIRNYLRFAYENYDSPAPFAVVLIGDGHYDFLDNLGRHKQSYIPPFVWPVEYSVGDDNYVYFDRFSWLDSDSSYHYNNDRGWDMMVARWPVRSSSEVLAHLEDIKHYESFDKGGNWRTRVTFVADDEYKYPIVSEIIHTAMAETLAVRHTPSEFIHNKIYATEYPFSSNGEKPQVNDAIIKAVNDGTLILNYIGHGSPDVWADEHILKKSIDLGRMQNSDRQTVVIAGSCSIGFFDDPGQEGMAEIMFRQRGAAIEAVSATRLVYATDNALFNYDVFSALFGNHCNVTEAVYTAKLLHQYSFNYSLIRNDRSFVVFGDPLAKVGLPEYNLLFNAGSDSIMTPLDYFGFSGSVTDLDGNPLAVDGTIELTAYDSRILRHHELGIEYTLGGPSIFRGSVNVEGGMFEGGFIVPLDIDYGGNAAALSGYGVFGNISGIGGIDSLDIASNAISTNDNSGPEISYIIEEIPDFVSGGRVPENATVVVNLSDESGINLTGGLGHRIEMVVDNDNNTMVNLTDKFSYTAGSYKSGELRFTLPDLTPEQHSFKIRAWDNANNPALVEFEATPSRTGRIALNDVMNYPNPMEDGTEFFFELSESAARVDLKIFTLSGKMIKSFNSENLPVGRNRLFYWDGRDFDGDRVAEGVYIYKISAQGQLVASGGTADNMAEAFGKLILLN